MHSHPQDPVGTVCNRLYALCPFPGLERLPDYTGELTWSPPPSEETYVLQPRPSLSSRGGLQVVVSGTAMAGSAATVTTKSHGETSILGGKEHQACSSAIPGDTSAESSSDWSIPAARTGAEPLLNKLPALSRRGGLRPGAKLNLLGANLRKHDVPADEQSSSSQLSRDRRDQAGSSSRSEPCSVASPPKSRAAGCAGISKSRPQAPSAVRAAEAEVVPENSGAKPLAAGSPGRPAAKPGTETASPRKRTGLHVSERSVEGVLNAHRPAVPPSKLRRHPETAHASAGAPFLQDMLRSNVRTVLQMDAL